LATAPRFATACCVDVQDAKGCPRFFASTAGGEARCQWSSLGAAHRYIDEHGENRGRLCGWST